MNNIKPILGGKYFIYDKIKDEIIETQITQLIDNVEIYYIDIINREELYRDWSQFEIKAIINERDAMALNNQDIFSVSYERIRAIISREEIVKYTQENKFDFNTNETILISITDNDKSKLPKDVIDKYLDSLEVQFWDVEEDIGKYTVISDDIAKDIYKFISNNKDKSFVVHCEAGISRSAGVGRAIECICDFNSDLYVYATSSTPLKKHHRYSPNMTVYDKIMRKGRRLCN